MVTLLSTQSPSRMEGSVPRFVPGAAAKEAKENRPPVAQARAQARARKPRAEPSIRAAEPKARAVARVPPRKEAAASEAEGGDAAGGEDGAAAAKAAGVRRRQKFGVSKLRLKGATEITEAARLLTSWESELQAQEDSLSHYQEVVAQRERALLLAEAEVLRQRQDLSAASADAAKRAEDATRLQTEAEEVAALQRGQALKIREEETRVRRQAATLAARLDELTAAEASVRHKHEVAAELSSALKEREAALNTKESRLAAEAEEFGARQRGLSRWQTQVEKLVSSLTQQQQQQLSQIPPLRDSSADAVPGGVIGQDAAEHALAARQAELQRRVSRCDQLEQEVKRREAQAAARAEALTRRAVELQSAAQPADESVASTPNSSGTSSSAGGGGATGVELRRLGMQLEERRREVERRTAAAAALEAAAVTREQAAMSAEAELEEKTRASSQQVKAERARLLDDLRAQRVSAQEEAAALELRGQALTEAEEAVEHNRGLLAALESRTLGREAKATKKERELLLRERALAEQSAEVEADARVLAERRAAMGRGAAEAQGAAAAQQRMDAEMAALGEWEKVHAEESRAAMDEMMAV